VLNANKVRVTGNKANAKVYTRFSLYPGGLKKTVFKDMMASKPERIIETGVRGMLPKNKLGRGMFGKLHVYVGGEHPHQAQKPETLNV
jgi:large subunit ribosomal protein L13